MADVDYPAGLPLPRNNGLVYTWANSTKTFNPAKGGPVAVLWAENSINIYNFSWVMTTPQNRGFTGWFFNLINNGSEWFNMDVPWRGTDQGQLQNLECNFLGNQPNITFQGGLRIMTAEIGVRIPVRGI